MKSSMKIRDAATPQCLQQASVMKSIV